MARAGDQEQQHTGGQKWGPAIFTTQASLSDDLDATMDWFTKVAGYRWTDVVEVEQQGYAGWRSDDPDADGLLGRPTRLSSCRPFPARSGFPRIRGVHHVGYWSDDVESDLATLGQWHGLRVKSCNPDGSANLRRVQRPGRTKDRLVSRAMEPFIEYWWATAV